MQQIYAITFEPNINLIEEKKVFKKSILDIFDSCFLVLSFFKYFYDHCLEQLETIEKKTYLKSEDKKTYLYITQNPYLQSIIKSERIEKYIKKQNKIYWEGQFSLAKKIDTSLKENTTFQKYLDDPANDEEQHLSFLNFFFKKIIAPNSFFGDLIQDTYINGATDLPFINTFISKQLKGLEENSFEIPEMQKYEIEILFGLELFEKTIINNDFLQKQFEDTLQNWDLERVTIIDTILIKMAIAEFLFFEDIPIKVTLNEYLEIAKDYSTPKSASFINGIINNVANNIVNKNIVSKKINPE